MPDRAPDVLSGVGGPVDAGHRWAIPIGTAFRRVGVVLPVVVLLLLSIVFIGSVIRFSYYSPVSNVEELALMYTAAQNFIAYGFLHSMFLQDLSTSSRAADHPYVYNHMPPGPDICIAVMLKMTGGSYRLLRVGCLAEFVSEMVCVGASF